MEFDSVRSVAGLLHLPMAQRDDDDVFVIVTNVYLKKTCYV